MENIAVERVLDRPDVVLAGLVEESTAQGYNSLRRLVAEWLSGVQRFDRHGEGLFVALREGRVAGVCGLEVDRAGADPSVGRLRDMYVSTVHRRSGVGRALAARALSEARESFAHLMLQADTPGARTFFTSLGFRPASAEGENSYYLDLREAQVSG